MQSQHILKIINSPQTYKANKYEISDASTYAAGMSANASEERTKMIAQKVSYLQLCTISANFAP